MYIATCQLCDENKQCLHTSYLIRYYLSFLPSLSSASRSPLSS